jgi:hypothetical protein
MPIKPASACQLQRPEKRRQGAGTKRGYPRCMAHAAGDWTRYE